MARKGPAPRPAEQQAARGETRPSRERGPQLIEFPVLAEHPDPPGYLNQYARDLWDDVAPHLFAQRRLTQADVHALGHMCQLHGEIVDGYERRIAPTSAQLNALRMYFVEFGMTPAARMRLTAPPKDKEANPFNRNGSRKKQ